MTPGELRTLLGRYQRRLHDLAEAMLPPTAAADDAGASSPALADLRADWQDRYYVTLSDGLWSASPFADRTVVLTAGSASELTVAVQNDHAERAMQGRRCE